MQIKESDLAIVKPTIKKGYAEYSKTLICIRKVYKNSVLGEWIDDKFNLRRKTFPKSLLWYVNNTDILT